jgi:peroxiredoxin
VVYLDGQPLPGGRITFLGPADRVAANEIGPDGAYTVAAPPPGPVKVTVTGRVVTPIPDRGPLPANVQAPDRASYLARSETPSRPKVPHRYADPSLTPLNYTVITGPQTYDVRLTSDEGPQADPAAPRTGLGLGQIAPDIEGPDLDGMPFKLSDHRGRAVLVVFWGHWCSLCRDEYASLRALAGRQSGRPFVMLGVNSDSDRETARRAAREHALPWRSWRDGDISGQVARTWEVQGWPTFYLLDENGAVRARNVRGPELERAVEEVLAKPTLPPQLP